MTHIYGRDLRIALSLLPLLVKSIAYWAIGKELK